MRRYNWIRLLGVLVMTFIGFVFEPGIVACEAGEAPSQQILQKMACGAFIANFQKPCVTIISAALVEATQGVPQHCDMCGMMLPDIGFSVNLPNKWNGRFYMVGNGSYSGRIRHEDMVLGLQKGYATASTDTGHDVMVDPFGTFAYRNRQKTIDWCFRAVHETTLLAKDNYPGPLWQTASYFQILSGAQANCRPIY